MLEHPLREAFVIKPGDTLITGKVVQSLVVRLDAPVTASVDRFARDFAAGEELTPVLLKQTKHGKVNLIFCGPDQRAIGKFTELMIGDWFSKFEAVVRFCFIDEDGDGRFEAYLLGGAKDPAMQVAFPITPVAYNSQELVPRNEADNLSMVYRKFVPEEQKLIFDIRMTIDGKPVQFDMVRTLQGAALHTTYPVLRTNPRKMPYPYWFTNVAGAQIGILKVDGAGTAEVSVDRNFEKTLVKPISIQTQIIYVYVAY